ncbi:MAG: UDP-3-O-(3-hydroxymyristoyl)glucosamine N-acyltransferase [Planctomycetota bacterium]|jgi:UDP-3-O-[3-hydroxymyristoyl] glucosamine N-acyltransferase|nr:UDP-3-O-(3-hydroxymyristoyl)glucosamine N-acyltransferase [Planctomycetota bacterium]
MRVRVAEVAKLLEGRIIGDPELELTGISSLTEAGPGDVSFLANPKYAPHLADTRAAAVLVDSPHDASHLVQIVVANPDWAFAQLVSAFGPQPGRLPIGVHPTAVIGDGVTLGEQVAIGAYVVIGEGAIIGDNCRIHAHAFIGDDATLGTACTIHPHVTVREGCQLGNKVIIHSGAVIGSDGFGYASVEGVHHKIPQVGIVVVGDDVEIGANTTIDRARFGKTIIGAGSKLDNLVQIAHNVEVGRGCIITAQCGIAGSTTLGSYVTIAGQSGLSGHITIGDQAIIAGQSGVTKNVPAKAVIQGSPATNINDFRKGVINVRRMPQTIAAVKQMEQRLATLEARLAELEGTTGDAS